MNAAIFSTDISSNDRLGMTLFAAAAVHAVVILGISFKEELFKQTIPLSVEVLLVQQQSEQAPDEADYLAQVSQDGGGSSDDNDRPQAPFSANIEQDSQGLAPKPLEASAPKVSRNKEQAVITTVVAKRQVDTAEKRQPSDKPKTNISPNVIEESMEVAKLAAEINDNIVEYAKRPRKKFITARTREVAAAAYMHQWVQKVERIGNLNYPDAARIRKMNGSLVLVVGINRDGSIHEITLRRSSGKKILDDAAKRIVQLAAPYAPLTGKLGKQTDILYITRTWDFKSEGALSSD